MAKNEDWESLFGRAWDSLGDVDLEEFDSNEGRGRGRRRKFQPRHLDLIYDRTDGRCHICHFKHKREAYGRQGRYVWQVDHRKPLAKGGTDTHQNWRVSCVGCNAEKGTMSSRDARAAAGTTSEPLSRQQCDAKRAELYRMAVAASVGVGASVCVMYDWMFGAVASAAAFLLLTLMASTHDPNER
jgi:hypothetical protein